MSKTFTIYFTECCNFVAKNNKCYLSVILNATVEKLDFIVNSKSALE